MHPCLLATAKISVLVLLYKIFITRAFRITVITFIAIVLAWWVSNTLGAALLCQPVSSHWDPNTPGHCGNLYVFEIIICLPWIVTDFAILIAPLPMVRNLHTSTRQKVILMGLFIVCGL